MKNTYWDAIEPGDVVSFIYKGQGDDAKSARRVVICLDPRYEHRKKSTNRVVDYFVGLEIFNSQKSNINPTVIKQTFELYNLKTIFLEPGLIEKSWLWWQLPYKIKWFAASLPRNGTRSILGMGIKKN